MVSLNVSRGVEYLIKKFCERFILSKFDGQYSKLQNPESYLLFFASYSSVKCWYSRLKRSFNILFSK